MFTCLKEMTGYREESPLLWDRLVGFGIQSGSAEYPYTWNPIPVPHLQYRVAEVSMIYW
jgi:hypothetical protein